MSMLHTMSAIADEVELSKKHEEILGRRAVLLGLMQSRNEQQNSNKSQRLFESQAAQERNSRLLEDMQKLEERLNRRQLPHPDILALEVRYWTSVEESIPDWEQFLLGKGPHPIDPPGPCPRRAKQRANADPDHSLPPRPKAKPVK